MNQNGNKVKYYPRLLTGALVRAVLSGHKTATRWPLRKQPLEDVAKRKGEWVWEDVDGNIFPAPVRPGDVIWVRETWSQDDPSIPPVYRANGRDWSGCPWTDEALTGIKWRPAIHMPQRIARVFLFVDKLRLVQIGDITEEEAESEGFAPVGKPLVKNGRGMKIISAREQFIELWDTLYSARKKGFSDNPYVWAADFHLISRDEAREVCRG